MKVSVTDLSKDNDAGGKIYSAPALEKGLDIIELLCASEAPLSQKDIAQRLGRSVGEIYRMLACLVSRNYASLSEENYAITTKLFELAHANPPTHRLLLEAVPIMQKLAGQLDQSCHLTVYGRGSQIVIAKVDSPGGMGFSVRVGAELDLLPSISGRVLLAFQDEEIRVFRIAEGLQRKPEHADPQIAGVLDFIRARGFEAAPSVQVRGLYAISFPILASQGRAIAALTVPYAERIDQSQRKSISEVQDALRDAAALLTSRVAGQLQPSGPRAEAAKTKRRPR
jgi:DNA-binding IclR family transcriptional regulator